MITSFPTPTNHHPTTKHDHQPLANDTEGDPQFTMSNVSQEKITYLETNNTSTVDSKDDDDDDDADENSKLVSIALEARPQEQQQTTVKTLRSILRKRTEKRTSIEAYQSVQQTSIMIDENVHDENDNDGSRGGNDADHAHDEKDSDYTGDEKEEGESSGSSSSSSISDGSGGSRSNKSVEEENKNNEQQHCRNYSRHQRRDEFFRTLPSTSFVSPLDTSRTETGLIETGTTTTTSAAASFYGHDQSSTRATCVTFTNDHPIIIHRSSSTPLLGGFADIQPRSSITYINMKEDISMTTTPITTATTTGSPTMLGAEFRPVYVSPLKYRPLVGLSANDSRLLLEKRVSLLGKPLVFHPIQKRSPSYRRTQLRVYNFLERPHGCKAILYHTFVFLTVFLCLFLSVVATMPEYESIASTVLLQTEVIVVIWLATELGLRIWSAGCCSRYQALMGRLRFLKKPFCALDFTMIVATVITLCLNSRGGNGVFAASALRGLRFFQILRMLRMDRRGGTWKLLGSVVYAHRQELITTIYIGFLVLIFSSFIMFLVEKDIVVEPRGDMLNSNLSTIANFIDSDRHKFETFADALWWGIITLCTVGYGDKVPSSYIGKLIAAICSFIGISFFALPAGILGSGFALKVQQQQRQKHYKRRKIPAVLLIQNLWRVYAADEKSLSKATWKVHVRPPRKETTTSTTSQGSANPASFRVRNNQSFLNRVSFRRRTPTRETPSTPVNSIKTEPANSSVKSIPSATVAAMRSCIDTLSETATLTRSPSVMSPVEGSSSDNEDDHFYFANDVQSLTAIHRHAIRFVRKVKYFVARRKFREALRPYDVTDVIEQYSTGNVDMLARMKYLQARLDKVLGISKSVDSYESGPSLASRICKIEKQVDGLDLKVDRLCQLASSLLERAIRQDTTDPTPTPIVPPAPIVINRIRTGSYRPAYRRRRPVRHLAVVRTLSEQDPSIDRTQSTSSSPRTNVDQATVPPTVPPRDYSRESLISLYWLFQDHLNASRTVTL